MQLKDLREEVVFKIESQEHFKKLVAILEVQGESVFEEYSSIRGGWDFSWYCFGFCTTVWCGMTTYARTAEGKKVINTGEFINE